MKQKRRFFAMMMPWMALLVCLGVGVINQRRLHTDYKTNNGAMMRQLVTHNKTNNATANDDDAFAVIHNKSNNNTTAADDADALFTVTAIIVEIRCNPALSLVLLAAEEFYGPEVKIVVYHSVQNARFVQGLMEVHPTLQNSQRIFRHQIIPENYGEVEYKKTYHIYYSNYWYSRMLTNLNFWETISTPYALTMQSDTLVCRRFHLKDFAPRNESYIGGISGFKREVRTIVKVNADPNPNEYIKYNHLDGGYSLRRVDWVQRCIQLYGKSRVWVDDALFRHCQEMEIEGTVYVNELQAYSFASNMGRTVCFTDPTSGSRVCPMATHKPWKAASKIWGKSSYQEMVDYCPALIQHERLSNMPMESNQVCPAFDPRQGKNNVKTFRCDCDQSGSAPTSPIQSTGVAVSGSSSDRSDRSTAKIYGGMLRDIGAKSNTTTTATPTTTSPTTGAPATQTKRSECPQEPCNLNIAFLGDSLTRYQYISLVHFLRFNNTWIEPTDHPSMVVAQTYLGEYETRSHWNAFYENTTKALAPYEDCDCFRIGSQYRQIFENRYFYDPVRNNTITYIQAFGKMAIHGHWVDPVKANRDPALTRGPMTGNVPPAWSGDWADAIENHISMIQPTALVMNAGKWPNNFRQSDVRDALLKAIQKAGIPRVVWKTTTANRKHEYSRGEQEVDELMCGVMECFQISNWTRLVPQSLYHDFVHFYEPVYRKMNEELFSFLGVELSTPTLDWALLNPTKKPSGSSGDQSGHSTTSAIKAAVLEPPPHPHPHSGARDSKGNWGYVADVTWARRFMLERYQNETGNSKQEVPMSYMPIEPNEIDLVCGNSTYAKLPLDKNVYQKVQVQAPTPASEGTVTAAAATPKKILCGVYTHEGAHHRIPEIRDTYGWRCDGLLIVSTVTIEDPSNIGYGAVDIPHLGVEEYKNMWQKTRSILSYMHDQYLDDFDYFYLCGDDTHLIVENLRAFLQSIHDQYEMKPLFAGHLLPHWKAPYVGGGGGYVLNRLALKKLVNEAFPTCGREVVDSGEDVWVSHCLKRLGIEPNDGVDPTGSQRFFSQHPKFVATYDGSGGNYWGQIYQLWGERHGYKTGLDLVSQQSVSFHRFKKRLDMKSHHAVLYRSCPVGTQLAAELARMDAINQSSHRITNHDGVI